MLYIIYYNILYVMYSYIFHCSSEQLLWANQGLAAVLRNSSVEVIEENFLHQFFQEFSNAALWQHVSLCNSYSAVISLITLYIITDQYKK